MRVLVNTFRFRGTSVPTREIEEWLNDIQDCGLEVLNVAVVQDPATSESENTSNALVYTVRVS